MAQKKVVTPVVELQTLKNVFGTVFTQEDFRELDVLKVYTLNQLFDTFRTVEGDFTKLSDPKKNLEFSIDQSNRIGDAILSHPKCPQDIKDDYEASTPKSIFGEVEIVDVVPEPSPETDFVEEETSKPSVLVTGFFSLLTAAGIWNPEA